MMDIVNDCEMNADEGSALYISCLNSAKQNYIEIITQLTK